MASICALANDRESFDKVVDDAEKVLKHEPGLLAKLKICLKEIFANIREHAYQMDPRKFISLDIVITPREVVATVIHVGPRWRNDGYVVFENVHGVMRFLLESEAERGRGEPMIFMCCDSFEYRGGGCVAIMAWKRGDHEE